MSDAVEGPSRPNTISGKGLDILVMIFFSFSVFENYPVTIQLPDTMPLPFSSLFFIQGLEQKSEALILFLVYLNCLHV